VVQGYWNAIQKDPAGLVDVILHSRIVPECLQETDYVMEVANLKKKPSCRNEAENDEPFKNAQTRVFPMRQPFSKRPLKGQQQSMVGPP
jgi:hypothetical protein